MPDDDAEEALANIVSSDSEGSKCEMLGLSRKAVLGFEALPAQAGQDRAGPDSWQHLIFAGWLVGRLVGRGGSS